MDLYDSRILLVDDEKALSQMVEGLLRKEGYHNINTAADCSSARILMEENEYQMILLDVMLPDGDGFSLFEEMKQKDKNSRTPVIFLSARDEDYSRLKGLGLGADDYITKPFLPEELLLRVRAVLKCTFHIEETIQSDTIGKARVDWNAGFAAFSKWYLKDYPVDIYVIEEGIVVLGRPKGTIWKYNLSHSTDTMNAFIKYLPPLLLVDVTLLLVIPFLVLYRQNRRKEMERTTWIAGVSHDIRTPLSLVLGYADAIKKESMDAEAMQKAQVIEEQAIRIRTLITNLNMENKLAYGMGNWHKEKLLLPALIREVICEIMNRDIGEQYELDVDIPEELEQISVTGDRELVRRMLENLVNNAIVHNPKGCCISVALRKKKMGVLSWYELEISDNGCGVSKQQLKRLRAPLKFEKLSEHGLGIRLVRRIVAMHHWRVRFENQRNGGFCCRIQMLG